MQKNEPQTEIPEALITAVVHEFYDKIRRDALLAPIFNGKIPAAEWPAHLARMVDFWSSVLRGTGRYSGRPHVLHQPLPINQSHFAHWLTLFNATVKTLCTTQQADIFMDRAVRIAASLQAGMGLFPYAQFPNPERGN